MLDSVPDVLAVLGGYTPPQEPEEPLQGIETGGSWDTPVLRVVAARVVSGPSHRWVRSLVWRAGGVRRVWPAALAARSRFWMLSGAVLVAVHGLVGSFEQLVGGVVGVGGGAADAGGDPDGCRVDGDGLGQ